MFYRFRLLQFHVLQIPAFTIPCFTDSGFYNSMFYRFRLLQFHIMFYGFRILQFRVLQIPAFTIRCSTDSGFYNSGSFHSPFHSIPGFPVPCFTGSPLETDTISCSNCYLRCCCSVLFVFGVVMAPKARGTD